jgi:glycosyltransferase involved in cell wall biosynthesis
LICDDCSTDGTPDLVEALIANVPNARLVRRTENLGPSGNRDLGIRTLSSRLFTQIDGDDEFSPTKNEYEVARIVDPNTDICFSDIELVTADSCVIKDTSGLDDYSYADAFRSIATRVNFVPRDMLMSVDLYRASGGYDYSLSMYEDWNLKLRLCHNPTVRWRHARGEVGTIYNRANPKLSSGPAIKHVYCQLKALALAYDPEICADGVLIETCKRILGRISGKLKHLPDEFNNNTDWSAKDIEILVGLLHEMAGDKEIYSSERSYFAPVFRFLNRALRL